tara:strand:+ start:516 stop:791 length:276 start_codon:yes stop_codon:yes gene_type:complete
MRNPNYYQQIIHVLESLHKAHPTYNIGRHISTALDGYNDMWGVTDKEFLFALEKYELELNMDVDHIDQEEIDKIIKDGMNLERTLFEEEEE